MQTDGFKVSYIVAMLAEKYNISELKFYSLIIKFGSDCKPFAAE